MRQTSEVGPSPDVSPDGDNPVSLVTNKRLDTTLPCHAATMSEMTWVYYSTIFGTPTLPRGDLP